MLLPACPHKKRRKIPVFISLVQPTMPPNIFSVCKLLSKAAFPKLDKSDADVIVLKCSNSNKISSDWPSTDYCIDTVLGCFISRTMDIKEQHFVANQFRCSLFMPT
jgi:hypothetical protein